MDAGSHEDEEGRARRRQVRKACTNCRRAHACCEEQRPCQRCINLGLTDDCRDAENKKRGRKRKLSVDKIVQSQFSAPNLNFAINAADFGHLNFESRPTLSNLAVTESASSVSAKKVRTAGDIAPSLYEFRNNRAGVTNQSLNYNLDMLNYRSSQNINADRSSSSMQVSTQRVGYSTSKSPQQLSQIPQENQTSSSLQQVQQQFASSVMQQSTQMNNVEAELQRLREENRDLKQQVLSAATDASAFAKTILGLDLASRVGILLTVEGGRIVSWNSALRTALGYEEEDLYVLVKSWRDLIDENDTRRVFSALIEAVVNKMESYSLSFNLRHKSGQVVPSQLTTMISYDRQDQKPIFSISFISFGIFTSEQVNWSFTQHLQHMQVQSSRVKDQLANRDVNT